MIHAEIHILESNDHLDWEDFVKYKSDEPYDDFGWFYVTIGGTGIKGGNDFQVCVATPRAVGRIKRSGAVPGILVDCYNADSVREAIHERVTSISGSTWEDVVGQLRKFMLWEYEGMAGT